MINQLTCYSELVNYLLSCQIICLLPMKKILFLFQESFLNEIKKLLK